MDNESELEIVYDKLTFTVNEKRFKRYDGTYSSSSPLAIITVETTHYNQDRKQTHSYIEFYNQSNQPHVIQKVLNMFEKLKVEFNWSVE